MAIESSHHVCRVCKSTHLDSRDKPKEAAFALGPKDRGLSVNWLEFFGSVSAISYISRYDQINKVRMEYEHPDALSLGGKSKLAVMNVGDFVEKIRRDLRFRLRIETDATVANPSHAQIKGSRGIFDRYGVEEEKNKLIRTYVASNLVTEHHPGGRMPD